MAPTTLPRSVYAFAGAGDLVADELKKLAAQAPELQARAAELPAELRKLAADLPSFAAQLQAKAREVDVADVTAAVKKNVETAQHKAVDVYDELVERGQKVVSKTPAPRADGTTAEKKPAAKKAVAKKAPAKAVDAKPASN